MENKGIGGSQTQLRTKIISIVALIAVAAFVLPTASIQAFPSKTQDCSRCHGPSAGTYYDDIMSIAVSKSTLAPGENYIVGIDIVIQTGAGAGETGYAIQDLGSSVWVAVSSTAVQTHYDQTLAAPATLGTYNYRVWGVSGPANSDGKTDYDDYSITVAAANNAPSVTALTNKAINAGDATTFTAAATDPDGDTLRFTWSFGDGPALVVGNGVSHTYAKAGAYTFTVYVDDLHGHNISSSATVSVAFNLNIVAGWNLVGIPLVGYGYKASTLGLSTGDIISTWDMATQTYKTSYIVGISPPVSDFTIQPSLGYWVYATAAKTLHLFGTIPASASVTITLPSGGGWALLSYVGVNSVLHAGDIPAKYSGPAPSTVVKWTPTTHTYTTYVVGLPMNNFLLDPGMGFWVYFTAGGILTYIPS